MFWALTLTAIVFGTVLEAMQGAWMPGRTFDVMDVAADGLGATLVIPTFKLIFGRAPGRIASD
jgi:VanZ family protein